MLYEFEYDFFVSHASEDKEDVALPLANELIARGYKVWLDKEKLKMGDSLRRRIDDGLSKSRYGIVVLSKNFFKKEWPQKELDALISREDRGTKVIFPVWHQVTKDDMVFFSPLLADKLSVSTSIGIVKVAEEILVAVSSVGNTNLTSSPNNRTVELHNTPHLQSQSGGAPMLDDALRMSYRVLRILEEQAAGYTILDMPAHLKIQLEEKRKEIKALEDRITKRRD